MMVNKKQLQLIRHFKILHSKSELHLQPSHMSQNWQYWEKWEFCGGFRFWGVWTHPIICGKPPVKGASPPFSFKFGTDIRRSYMQIFTHFSFNSYTHTHFFHSHAHISSFNVFFFNISIIHSHSIPFFIHTFFQFSLQQSFDEISFSFYTRAWDWYRNTHIYSHTHTKLFHSHIMFSVLLYIIMSIAVATYAEINETLSRIPFSMKKSMLTFLKCSKTIWLIFSLENPEEAYSCAASIL